MHPTAWGELAKAIYMGAGAWYAFTHSWYGWLPLMLVSGSGFALMGGMSVMQALHGRSRRATSEDKVIAGAEAAG